MQVPWHESQWQVLQKCKQQNKLPHALVLTGQEGVGKQLFAEQFTSSLLCSDCGSDNYACGKCKNCTLIKAGNHPDLTYLVPNEKSQAIKVDQVRNIVTFVNQSAQLNKYKVILVSPADKMNVNAANALLKTLEEPSAQTLLILITNRLMALSATVRSRCQIVTFPVPQHEIAMGWLDDQKIKQDNNMSLLLALSNGAPFKVLRMLETDSLKLREMIFEDWLDVARKKVSIVTVSAKWQKLDAKQILLFLSSWVIDLIKISQKVESEVINIDVIETLKKVTLKCELKKLYTFYDEINHLLRWTYGQANLNVQLMLEGLLVKWIECFTV